MGTTSSSIFSGTSRYSSDFQQVITRAVSIASLPLQQLTNQKTNLTGKSTALLSLTRTFSDLEAAIGKVGDALGSASLSASVSDTSKAKASIAAGAMEGKYSIDIVDTGAYSTMMTAKWNDADGAHAYKLHIGGSEYAVEPANNTAAAFAAAVNAKYGDKVRASVVLVNPEAGDYRISLESASLGPAMLDITDSDGVGGQASLAAPGQQIAGWEAEYVVNHSGVTAHSTSRKVTISDGVTVDLLAATAEDSPVTIQVTRSSYALTSALSAFASAYNDAADAVGQQRGENAGLLAGDSVLWRLTSALRGISGYRAADSSLPDLKSMGLDLGKDGKLTFDGDAFSKMFSRNPSGILAFLGSESAGGFLKAAGSGMAGLLGAGTGTLTTAEKSVSDQIDSLGARIEQEQSRVDSLEKRLVEQMAAADALIASMEQQYSYLDGVFGAMDTANKQYA